MARSSHLTRKALRTRRDVLLLGLASGQVLVVSCDSSGGVGPKDHDTIRVDARKVGRYAARNALLELCCAGASAIALTLTLSTELKPTGTEIRSGLIKALREFGLPNTIPLTMSSEKNFAVDVTGIGVTALGFTTMKNLRIGLSEPGDAVLLLGKPAVGEKVLEAERLGWIPTVREIKLLLKSKNVHEILPVGSTGVLHEISVLTGDSGLRFEPLSSSSYGRGENWKVSAGPSTAFLLTVDHSNKDRLVKRLKAPVREIGRLR